MWIIAAIVTVVVGKSQTYSSLIQFRRRKFPNQVPLIATRSRSSTSPEQQQQLQPQRSLWLTSSTRCGTGRKLLLHVLLREERRGPRPKLHCAVGGKCDSLASQSKGRSFIEQLFSELLLLPPPLLHGHLPPALYTYSSQVTASTWLSD